MLERLRKPWFVHRPTQILRRVHAALRPPRPGYRALTTSWGIALVADPSRTIGRNIVTTGLYDIAVSEALARLIAPGSTVIDAGANVGYMSALAALAAGPHGKVIAFEPHPELVQILRANARSAAKQRTVAPVEVHEAALGETEGSAQLIIPDAFSENDGIASLVEEMDGLGARVAVKVVTLDQVIGDTEIEVMKIDVEGFELQALRGGIQALRAHRIRHVVFEDFHAGDSQVMRLFEVLGYRIYELGWTVERLALAPLGVPRPTRKPFWRDARRQAGRCCRPIGTELRRLLAWRSQGHAYVRERLRETSRGGTGCRHVVLCNRDMGARTVFCHDVRSLAGGGQAARPQVLHEFCATGP